MNKADCPSCGGKINVGPKPRMGQHFVCQSCKTELEVTWLDPVELDWLYGDEDEYEYEDDIDEDEDD
jgi:lysine biosynthesis protein LysW